MNKISFSGGPRYPLNDPNKTQITSKPFAPAWQIDSAPAKGNEGLAKRDTNSLFLPENSPFSRAVESVTSYCNFDKLEEKLSFQRHYFSVEGLTGFSSALSLMKEHASLLARSIGEYSTADAKSLARYNQMLGFLSGKIYQTVQSVDPKGQGLAEDIKGALLNQKDLGQKRKEELEDVPGLFSAYKAAEGYEIPFAAPAA